MIASYQDPEPDRESAGSFTSPGSLPAGEILNTGLLVIDGSDHVGTGENNGDKIFIFDFAISGTPIPEPSTLTLAAIGLVFLLGFGRRRKR